MSHSLALDDARLSEIRQDSCKEAVTDVGEFEPPPTAAGCAPNRKHISRGWIKGEWIHPTHLCHIGACEQRSFEESESHQARSGILVLKISGTLRMDTISCHLHPNKDSLYVG